MASYKSVWIAGVVATALGCGGGNTKGPDTPNGNAKALPPEHKVSPEAEKEFNAAVDELNSHDKNADWNDATCAAVANHFESAKKLETKPFPEASYDAGLAYQRCNDDKNARSHFEEALQANSAFHYARAQIALYQFKADGNLDSAISSLEQAVQDAKFNDVPALVDLSMFQMQRDSDAVGATCKTDFNGQEAALKDFECAKTNLQRALAIDDSYMPAFNQLALYYFTRAKKAAGKTTSAKRQIMTNASIAKRADVQQLELASLVTSQAIRKNAKYAPIHNTAGLILNELGQSRSTLTSSRR
jgi:tetratricopeptide (TPR) repeat protein